MTDDEPPVLSGGTKQTQTTYNSIRALRYPWIAKWRIPAEHTKVYGF